jgi:cysteine-rich repeat protein
MGSALSSQRQQGRYRGITWRRVAVVALLGGLIGLPHRPAYAVDYQGVVQFQGQVVFAAAIAGINAEDLTVSVQMSTEATGNGEKCSILSVSSDSPDVTGAYPDAGSVNAEILLERGGPQIPDGECIVTVQATGTDGVSVSARGSQTVFVTADEIDTAATVAVDDITVRQSKAVASLEKDCRKWVNRQVRKRRACNFKLLKKGQDAVDKCKDGGLEPTDCDPGDHVEAILALSWGINDQQAFLPDNPELVQALDFKALRDQSKCQHNIGKAAQNFALKRLKLVQARCVDAEDDSETCRDQQSNTVKKKLDKIDKCVGDQMTDGGTGNDVPDVEAPCDICIDAGTGAIDRKCLKGCVQMVVDDLVDGIIGDIPECGNGILQSPEFCDDGNLTNGDCCSDECTAENLGDQTCGTGICEVTVPICLNGEPNPCVPGTMETEGPMGDATCIDALDNDCDGDTDGADPDCQ